MRNANVTTKTMTIWMILPLLFLSLPGLAVAEVAHPLDALEDAEILEAAGLVLATGSVSDAAIFQSIEIREPSKDTVLGWQPGNAISRAATVFVRDAKKSYRTVVDLTAGTVAPLTEIPPSEGQIGLTINELLDFAFLFENAAFLEALAKRGIDDPNPGNVFVTPLTAGSFDLPEESGRIVKAQMYATEGASTHLYGRPIEGLQAIIDLDEQKIVELIDTGVVPMPDDVPNFDEATIDSKYGLSDALKPIRITQPEGANFTVDGSVISWQKWKFHVRFERRSGTVISMATFDGRSVLYQGALSEVFVPYQDPDVNWYYRTYMDAGEFGFGVLASPLFPGLDVPENAVLLDGLISAAIPVPGLPVLPLLQENVIGVYERVTGNPEWRHFELFAPAGPVYEGRAEVELVVRMAAQVGNYDYIIDWIFTQSGRLRVAVALTGIDIPKTVPSTTIDDPGADADTAHGTLMAPNLVATFHSHYFNFRLDLDVDGRDNRFVLGHLGRESTPGPRRGVWVLEEDVLATEAEGQVRDHGIWRVANAGKKNAMGYPTSYVLESHSSAERLMERRDFRRARFIDYPLWITAHHPDEIYASGDTPNQNPGAPGLPRYAEDDQTIVDTDIVLWHTLGFHHVTAAEDFPVLTREHGSFELRPQNFFDHNPSIDLRRAPFEVVAEP